MLRPYKCYYMYVAAVPAPALSDAWYVRALILPRDKVRPITEIKRFGDTELVFHSTDEAEDHALSLSKAWIDAQTSAKRRASLMPRVRN